MTKSLLSRMIPLAVAAWLGGLASQFIAPSMQAHAQATNAGGQGTDENNLPQKYRVIEYAAATDSSIEKGLNSQFAQGWKFLSATGDMYIFTKQ